MMKATDTGTYDIETDNVRIRDCHIGTGTIIYDFCNLYESKIGEGCTIGAHVEIAKATIGNNCSIQKGCSIPDGTKIGNNVFLAPQVAICNDIYPIAKNEKWKCNPVKIKDGASIGANATILPSVTIGKNVTVGAGCTVTKDVPDNVTIYNEIKMIIK